MGSRNASQAIRQHEDGVNMGMYAVRALRTQRLRLALTIGGVALCIVLMLFLLSVYRGVADGSVEYIRRNEVDLWVLQRNATNILRGSSLLSATHGRMLEDVGGVRSVSPVLLLLSSVKTGDQEATMFLTGFEHSTGIGGPPAIAEGRSVLNDDEIVLDRSFAAKLHVKVGDRIDLQEATLRVVGTSTGTNAFVIQYAFVTLHRAQSLIGFPNIVTCYLLRLEEGHAAPTVAASIRKRLSGLEVYGHETFLKNNTREMQSGFLLLLYTIAVIGAIVLTTILSLLLSINILERRKDFAVLKTLGSPGGFLSRMIAEQALLISSAGSVVALVLFFPMVAVIERIAPEVSTKSSVAQIAVVVGIVTGISLLSSFISVQRLRRIYALEAFS